MNYDSSKPILDKSKDFYSLREKYRKAKEEIDGTFNSTRNWISIIINSILIVNLLLYAAYKAQGQESIFRGFVWFLTGGVFTEFPMFLLWYSIGHRKIYEIWDDEVKSAFWVMVRSMGFVICVMEWGMFMVITLGSLGMSVDSAHMGYNDAELACFFVAVPLAICVFVAQHHYKQYLLFKEKYSYYVLHKEEIDASVMQSDDLPLSRPIIGRMLVFITVTVIIAIVFLAILFCILVH